MIALVITVILLIVVRLGFFLYKIKNPLYVYFYDPAIHDSLRKRIKEIKEKHAKKDKVVLVFIEEYDPKLLTQIFTVAILCNNSVMSKLITLDRRKDINIMNINKVMQKYFSFRLFIKNKARVPAKTLLLELLGTKWTISSETINKGEIDE